MFVGGRLVTKLCPTLVTSWTVARLAPLVIEFSRQEYWSGLPFPSPRDLPDPGIEPRSPALQADALPSEPPGKPLYITGPKQLIMICFGVIFYMFCALEFIQLLCGFIVLIKFQKFALIISSGVFFVHPPPFGDSNFTFIKLLEVVSQLTDALFIIFVSFSQCVSFWIVYIAMSSVHKSFLL